MVWEDMEYAPGTKLPNGKKRKQPEEVAFDREMFEHYRKLIHIRNAHMALQLGDYQTLLADDKRDLLAFARTYQNQKIVVVINNHRQDQWIKISLPEDGQVVDLLDEHRAVTASNGQIDVAIKARTGRILRRK
jgi:glycosidase